MSISYILFRQLVMKYVMTTSHKIIGVLYGYIGYIFGIIGYIVSMLIRSELNTTGLSIVRKVKEVNIYTKYTKTTYIF